MENGRDGWSLALDVSFIRLEFVICCVQKYRSYLAWNTLRICCLV